MHAHAPAPPCRRRALLAASSGWIREEELLERIHHALDNPQPFGFVRSLPVEHGY